METKSNKTIIAEFYKYIIGQRDETLIDRYVRQDYIQHSPSVKEGREGLREMVSFLKTLPPSIEKISPVKLLLTEGDLVAGLLHISFMGKHMFVVDLFRLKDGQLAEHWDAVEDMIAHDFDEVVIDLAVDVELSKQVVKAKYALLNDVKIHRIIGEGDLVIVQLEVIEDEGRFARYDILRVNGVEIDRILSVQQKFPDMMKHNNGML